jgi:nitrogen fixation protein FixH
MKNSWPLSIAAVYTVFATAMIGFAVYASTNHRVQLVAPDYYDQEIKYQQRMEQEERSRDLLVFETTDVELRLRFRDARAAGAIRLYRPSDAALDRNVPIELDATGCQVIQSADLARGLWKARVSWTSGGQDFFKETSFVLK